MPTPSLGRVIPRASLPTDEDCARLFVALEADGEHAWSVAMRLKHRSGVRWGELIALARSTSTSTHSAWSASIGPSSSPARAWP